MAKKPTHLTRREQEIVNAIFALGNRASADEIRGRLTNAPGDSSVRVMLSRLEKKGHVRHEVDGLRYLYSATTPTGAASRGAVQQLVQTFFGGSLTRMATALLRDGSWTDEELKALRAEIDRARKASKRS